MDTGKHLYADLMEHSEATRAWLIENIPLTTDPVRLAKLQYRLEWVEDDIKHMKENWELMTFDNVEEGECPIESDTCGMDTTKTLSEEKNKELMEHGLAGLGDLL